MCQCKELEPCASVLRLLLPPLRRHLVVKNLDRSLAIYDRRLVWQHLQRECQKGSADELGHKHDIFAGYS